MLFKLSIKNIQKSIKDYAIYFLTLVLGVAIFYVFNSIESQTVMMKVSSNTLEIINLMNQLLSSVSVFISFILGFLIYIPFIVIDMVVSSVLMSMGMMMLPPTTISMPFKVLLFILADGWDLVIGNLVKTFY